MSKDAIDKARSIRKGEELDLQKLGAYFREHLPEAAGPLEALQFPGGYSNLTYLLRSGEQEWVLRRPPFGANIKTAHDMGREYKVLSLLKPVYGKVPEPLLYCEEESVIGAPFYVMERVKGVILRNQPPQGLDLGPETMRRLAEATIDNLADLHLIDVEATGLIDFGKPAGYVQRQVEGWIRRYYKAETDTIPAMDQAATWMQANMPPDGAPAFIHNDYKYDNLVLNPDDLSEIRAVLDWEMATVGDPLMDLGTSLGYWVEAGDHPALKAFGLTWIPGNLSREEVAARYADRTGQEVSDLLFYYVFGCFKIGVIGQQIYARFKKGYTKDPRFGGLIHLVRAIAGNGLKAIETGQMSGKRQ